MHQNFKNNRSLYKESAQSRTQDTLVFTSIFRMTPNDITANVHDHLPNQIDNQDDTDPDLIYGKQRLAY